MGGEWLGTDSRIWGTVGLEVVYTVTVCAIFVSLSSSGLSSHYPHGSPGRSHWYPNLLDPTHSTGGYNWVQDLL